MKKIIPHIFVAIAFIILCAMGTWQVQRLHWKKDLIAKVDARLNAAPIGLSEYKNLEEDEFRTIKLSGTYQHDKQIVLLNKSYNGKAGYYAITPILTESGESIFVNRGWVKSEEDPLQPTEPQEIEGVVRGTQKLNTIGKLVIIPNTPSKNQWFWLDLPEMYKAVELPEKDFYIDLINTDNSRTFPHALPKEIKLYNEHMQYVITWYSLAVALLIMYYFRFFRKTKS